MRAGALGDSREEAKQIRRRIEDGRLIQIVGMEGGCNRYARICTDTHCFVSRMHAHAPLYSFDQNVYSRRRKDPRIHKR